MKKTSRLSALILALILMLALFAGCGGNTEPTNEANVTTPAPTGQPSGSEETEPPEEEGAYFPLAETETITYWYVYPPFFASFLASPADGQFFTELENRTNVEVEFYLASTETSSETFSIMAAGGDYTDLIQHGEQFFKGGGDASIEEDAFIRLNEYIEEFAPDYAAALDRFDSWKDVTTDEGNIVSFYGINEGLAGPDKGLAIRKDWLDELSLDVPQTYDEFYDVMLAFQSELGVASPLDLNYSGTYDTDVMVMGFDSKGYTKANQNVYPFYQINGNVVYGPMTDEFKEYVTLMNKWYSEGIIYPDFVSNTESSDTPEELIYNETVGVMHIMDTNMAATAQNSGVEGMELVAVPELVKEVGQQLHMYGFTAVTTQGSVVVSKNAEDDGKAELICRWLNYNYTDEGSLLFNYGIEGNSFEYVDGKPQLTELVTNNPDGLIMNFAMAVYVQQFGPAVVDTTRSYVNATEAEKDAKYQWANGSDGAYYYPAIITMNADESSEFSRVFADIETFVSEYVVQFIVGTRSLDEWDSYASTIESMGIATCIELKQAAYDRYMAR